MNKSILVFLALLSIGADQSLAQHSGQLGQFDLIPQRVYANPAFMPKAKVNVAFPALGNIYFEHRNNWIKPTEFIETDASGNGLVEANTILRNIDESADLAQGFDLELLHVGVRLGKKHYAHLRVSERFQMEMVLPVDIFNLAVYGNAGQYQFEDNTADFSDLGINAIHFREYAIGFNTEIRPKLRVGLTAKYLYGMEVIRTKESSLKLRTDPNTYELTSFGRYEVNTAGIYAATSDEEEELEVGEYLFGKKNTGFGFDIGGTYEPIENLEVQLSGHDLGWITWRDDIANYGTDDATFLYDGVDLSDFLFEEDGDFSQSFEEETDSLLEELEDVYNFERTEGKFTTSLNGYLRYGGAYQLYEKKGQRGSVWINAMHGIGRSSIPFRVSLGYNQTVWNSIQAGVHLTKQSQAPISAGGGLSLNAGFFQIYTLVENIQFARLTRVTVIDSDDSSDKTEYTLPSRLDDIRLHFGINFTFGRIEKDAEGGRSML